MTPPRSIATPKTSELHAAAGESGTPRVAGVIASDAQLAALAAQGDRPAFASLIRRHEQVAFRLACLYSGGAADAQDAVQEALVKVWRGLPGFDPERAPF